MIATASLMQLRVTGAQDPTLAVLIGDVAADLAIAPERAEVVVIGEEEGAPVGFCCGYVDHGQAILTHIGIRPGFEGYARSRALADGFVAAMAARGSRHVVVPVDPTHPSAPWTRMLLRLWPAHHYATSVERQPLEWWVRYADAGEPA